MDHKAIFKLCKELGCCDACCVRYLGVKNPIAYENTAQYIIRYLDATPDECTGNGNCSTTEKDNGTSSQENNGSDDKGDGPPAKRQRGLHCVSCLGVLQPSGWAQTGTMVQEMVERKGYECSTFACALSAPIATMLREHAVTRRIKHEHAQYDPATLTPLKEAWKWSFGPQLEPRIHKTLDSGAISPLLITVALEYPDEAQELETLKTLSPSLFESRSRQRRRFAVEFTRRSVEQALEEVTYEALGEPPPARVAAACVSVTCAHAPLYLGGRYIKLSRSLPQTPWLVAGKRMLPSSVQEIIFEPLARSLGIPPEDLERRLKLVSAGREDVDVRCLGEGRPFAVEVSDPRRVPSPPQLREVCRQISEGGDVRVEQLVVISRDDLTELKKGEESKSKTYEALCLKLTHAEHDGKSPSDPVEVTSQDIDNINNYTNTSESEVRIRLTQRTPIRVLHRRPLLARTREIYELKAEKVKDHGAMFVLRVRCAAGTYVKEWAHGELGRSRPSLSHALRARTDLLRLDVVAVHVQWPPNK